MAANNKTTPIVEDQAEPAPQPERPEKEVREPIDAPSGGIVNTAARPAVEPKLIDVNEETETVEGRLNKITESGSRYTDLAKKDAIRNANSRGLINSSMAAGAGTEAAIRSGLDVAKQDAQMYADKRTNDQNSENEFLKNRQSADLNIERDAAKNELDMRRDTHSTELNILLEDVQSSNRMDESQWDADIKIRADKILSDEKFNQETKIQYINSIDTINRDANAAITEISISDASPEQQAGAIQNIKDNRDAQISVYEDLLNERPEWDWSTDFTQDEVNPVTPDAPFNASEWTKVGSGKFGARYTHNTTGETIGMDEFRARGK